MRFPRAAATDGKIVTLVTEGNVGTIVIEVGLKNQGDSSASLTVLNLIVPAWTREHLTWSGPQGEDLAERSAAAETEERLTDPAGAATDAVSLRSSSRASPVARTTSSSRDSGLTCRSGAKDGCR